MNAVDTFRTDLLAIPGAAVFAIVVIGIFGLLIGSFLNVVIWRVPQDMSVVSPPSACPKCERLIRWYENIPVFSYLFLGGKCAGCKTRISVRYPLVELFTGVVFAVLAWASVSGFFSLAVLPALLYVAAITIALGMIDLDVQRLPNVIVLPAYIVVAALLALASLLTGDWWALAHAGIGMAALWLFYFLMILIYPSGMGGGDVKLAGVLGMIMAYFGWSALLVGAFSAFLIGGVVGAVLMIFRGATRKSAIPFGPFMLLGAWVGITAGPAIGQWYLNLVGLA